MVQQQRLTAIIEREVGEYVSLCPELDTASQGASVEQARANLVEALTLFFETADSSEVDRRFRREVFVTQRFRLGRLRILSGSDVCRMALLSSAHEAAIGSGKDGSEARL